MSLLLRELKAFAQEQEHCGELDGGVEGERWGVLPDRRVYQNLDILNSRGA
jgi:hypothetical protein